MVKYLSEAVDKVRRREVQQAEELRNTRFIWLKDQINLTEKQRLKFKGINLANYKTSKAQIINSHDLCPIKTLNCSFMNR